jgi:BirA family biotin operon repressor/biotin-[acetyl-CoA-carboxylase] ligase
MDLYQLLRLLSDGQFHSGSELGDLLGLSRTSIWKTLSHLASLSIVPEIIKGKGYRIPGGLDLLDLNKLNGLLVGDAKRLCDLDAVLSCTSTNDYIAARAAEFSVERYKICLAEFQTSGRGRRGRSWISPFAKNIYMSVGFKVNGGIEALSGLSLVVGLAMASALSKLGVPDCCVKWPNDVLVGGKKICGVLIELQGEATTGWDIVCGVGLNVAMKENDAQEIDQAWISLQQCLLIDRNKVAAIMLEELIGALEHFKRQGFSAFESVWKQYDYLFGKELTVSPANLQGYGAGIDAHGALLVNVAGELMTINAGEVSVRRI